MILLIAAAITGQVAAQSGGTPLPSSTVRLWTQDTKGWSISTTTTTDGTGTYTFTVGDGDYLIDVLGPTGGPEYGDRWFDTDGSGYIAEDADVITVSGFDVPGVDILLQVTGGIDGTVLHPGGAAASSMWVRLEQHGEIRIHHNDFTDAPTGRVSFRGVVPSSDYQILVYDPMGIRDTLAVPGPFGVVSGSDGSLGTLTMADAPADPNEGNNTPSCSAVSIDATALHSDPPQPWASTGARIGPLTAQDVDWYCFPAVDGDRLLLTATTVAVFNGQTRAHPWTDPLMSFWDGAGVTKLAENDDGGGGFDARIDTGPLTAGCKCVAVTTFGDADYNGSGQNSTGAYQLQVVMGNRPPMLSIKKGATEVPATFSIDEGDTLALNLSYVDADHDLPTTTFTHQDSGGAAVSGGTLTLGPTTGTYTWTAPLDGALGSPYTLTLTAHDSELTSQKTVILIVNSVNDAPTSPTLVSPIDDAVVATGTPPLLWNAATDPDGDTLHYDLELYDGDPTGAPAQTATGVSATTWTPAAIAENTRVSWRVRAGDPAGAVSPWSAYGTFLVDSANDPPGDPVLLKPADEETVAMRRPGLSVLNVTDPEDDDILYVFEIADEPSFTAPVWTSDPIPADTVSTTTMTGPDADLDWGQDYFARVQAQDVRGGLSAWSDPHHFRLKDNVAPGTPGFDGGCVAETYTDAPPDQIVVTNVDDPEGEALSLELKVWRFDDDPATTDPVFETTVPQSTAGTTTAIPVDLTALDNGHYRYQVRAYDGTDFSSATECDLTIDIATTTSTPDGGCCDAGTEAPVGAALLALLVSTGLLARARGGARARRRGNPPPTAR